MNLRNWAGRFGAVWALLCAVWLFAGCKTQSPKSDFSQVQGAPPPTATTHTAVAGNPSDTNAGSVSAPPLTGGGSSTELLKVGALLSVKFSDLPSPAPDFDGRVKEDGTITLFLNQSFVAAGKTEGELAKEIRERYVPKYYKYMTVNVTYQIATRFYYVGGEVKSPGPHPYIARIKILEAIQSAGDFTEYANKSNVLLTRGDGRKITVNCKKAMTHPELNVEIFPDDRIQVRKSLW